MNTKHTQGEWTLNAKNRSDMRITNGEKGFVIAEVTSDGIAHFLGNQAEAEANAKLIAASPKLLGALITAYSFMITNKEYQGRQVLETIKDAIKAATE